MTKQAKPVMLDKDGYLTINPDGKGDEGGGDESVFLVPVVTINAMAHTATLKYSFDDLKQAWEDGKQIILIGVGSGGPTGYTGHVYNLVYVNFIRNETEEEDMENDEVSSFQFERTDWRSDVSMNIISVTVDSIGISADETWFDRESKSFS